MLIEHGEYSASGDKKGPQRNKRDQLRELGRHSSHPKRTGHLRHSSLHRRPM